MQLVEFITLWCFFLLAAPSCMQVITKRKKEVSLWLVFGLGIPAGVVVWKLLGNTLGQMGDISVAVTAMLVIVATLGVVLFNASYPRKQ